MENNFVWRSARLRSHGGVPSHKTLALSLLLLAAAAVSPLLCFAQEYESSEYDLKAAILLNLVKFVEWPPSVYSSAQAPTVLCTLGRDPFGSVLDQFVSKENSKDRPFLVRRLRRGDDPHGCHLVYISSSERKLLAQVLKSIEGGRVLTIGEMEQFATQGGMIQITVQDKQVHFTINLNAASHEQLQIRSGLLALSRIVESNASLGAKN